MVSTAGITGAVSETGAASAGASLAASASGFFLEKPLKRLGCERLARLPVQ